MDRVNGNNPVDIGGGRRGFKSQNAAAGIAGTEVTDTYLNDVQEEICAVIENSGFVLDPENQQQLWEALQSIAAPGFANRTAWLPVISMTTTAPPNDAVLGDAYIIPAGATGVWVGNQQKLAEWTGSTWRIVTTREGHGVSLPDGRVFEKVGGVYVEKIAIDSQSGKWSFAVATGSATALAAILSPAPQSLVPGMSIRVKVATTNTGPATLNVNGLGVKPLLRSDGTPLKAGDLPASAIVTLSYDGANWQLMGVSAANAAASNSVSFTNPGTSTWTVPDGIYRILCECWGGGGGGGGAGSNGTPTAGSGGGAGAYVRKYLDVTPGAVLNVVVGAGGSGGSWEGGNGGYGGTSSFGSLLSAVGGGGGKGVINSIEPGVAGLGGVASGGDVNISGGSGGLPVNIPYSSSPLGGSGGPSYSTSSPQPNQGGPGFNGNTPGGGASAGSIGVAGNFPGGTGANGLIVISY